MSKVGYRVLRVPKLRKVVGPVAVPHSIPRPFFNSGLLKELPPPVCPFRAFGCHFAGLGWTCSQPLMQGRRYLHITNLTGFCHLVCDHYNALVKGDMLLPSQPHNLVCAKFSKLTKGNGCHHRRKMFTRRCNQRTRLIRGENFHFIPHFFKVLCTP